MVKRTLQTTAPQQRRRVGRPWPKGQSGNPKGRRPGVPNRATLEVKAFFTHLLTDEAYTRSLLKRLRKGTAGATEQLAFYYAAGKPKEHVEVEAGASLIDLVTASLKPKENA